MIHVDDRQVSFKNRKGLAVDHQLGVDWNSLFLCIKPFRTQEAGTLCDGSGIDRRCCAFEAMGNVTHKNIASKGTLDTRLALAQSLEATRQRRPYGCLRCKQL